MDALPALKSCCEFFMEHILSDGDCDNEDDKGIDLIESQVCRPRK